MTTPPAERRVWTIPNIVSFARLIILLPLVAVFILRGEMWWAIGALVVLGATDWIDGFLARRLDQVTLLGTRLDPLADRLAIVVVTLGLVIIDLLPWEVLGVILGVDLTLTVVALIWFRGSPDMPVSRIGKWRTAALLAGLPVLLVAAAADLEWLRLVGLVLLWSGVAGHVLAGVGYVLAMARRRPAAEEGTAERR